MGKATYTYFAIATLLVSFSGCVTRDLFSIPNSNDYRVSSYTIAYQNNNQLYLEFEPRTLKPAPEQKAPPSVVGYVVLNVPTLTFGKVEWTPIPDNLRIPDDEVIIEDVISLKSYDAMVQELRSAPSSHPLKVLKGSTWDGFLLGIYDPVTHRCTDMPMVQGPNFTVVDEWAKTKKVILFPFAVVADVATSPIQLVLLLVSCNSTLMGIPADCSKIWPWNW